MWRWSPLYYSSGRSPPAPRRRRRRPTIEAVDSPALVSRRTSRSPTGDDGPLGVRPGDRAAHASRRRAPTGASTRRATPAAPRSTHTFTRAGHLHVPLQAPRRHDRHGHRRGRRRAALRRARLLPHHRLPPRRRDRRRPDRDHADGRGRATSTSTLTEDPTRFTDAGLRPFEVVVFLNTDGEGILNAAQRTAFERWTQRGGGIVSIHADANADRNWAWKGDMMGGAWFLNHPAGAAPVPDRRRSTSSTRRTRPRRDLPQPNWVREDEWYNFTAEPAERPRPAQARREHLRRAGRQRRRRRRPPDLVVLELRRRAPLLHRARPPGHATGPSPTTSTHIRGAIEWASGEAPGDCGPEREGLPTDASFDKVTLDDTTENPMEIAVDADGNVYYVELAGSVKHYDRATGASARSARSRSTAATRTACSGSRSTRTSRPTAGCTSSTARRRPRSSTSRASRSRRRHARHDAPSRCCCGSRTSGSSAATPSGSLTFGPDGNLYISTGDDTQHAESQGYNPIDDRLAQRAGRQPGRRPRA